MADHVQDHPVSDYTHIAILRSCIEALPASDMDETMMISLDAAQDHIDALRIWIRDAMPLVVAGTKDPKVTTSEYAQFLKTRSKSLMK